MMMNENEIVEKLKAEGFTDVYAWEDGPNASYPEHTHEKLTAHVIVKGEMTLTDASGTKTLKAGDRFDVPAGTVHKATMGPSGCRYIVGE